MEPLPNPRKYLYCLDPSMEQTGLVIFDIETFEPVVITHIHTNKKDTHGQRLYQIKTTIASYIDVFPVYAVVIERGFSKYNTSTQVTYRVHGVINLLFKDYEQVYYPPKKVKATIIDGNATKKDVQDKILSVYPNVEFKCEDESDAFAVGLTYLILKMGMKWDKSKIKKEKTRKKKGTQ